MEKGGKDEVCGCWDGIGTGIVDGIGTGIGTGIGIEVWRYGGIDGC